MTLFADNQFRLAPLAVAAVLGLAALPGQALAESATVTTNTDLRYGPSYEYRIVTSIRRGADVNVLHCVPERDWCEVDHNRDRGWIEARHLRHGERDFTVEGAAVTLLNYWLGVEDYDYDRSLRYEEYRYDDDWYERERERHGNNGNSRGRGDPHRPGERGDPHRDGERGDPH
jgi:uncharacterized protein YraI